jgi:hypothetical protein
MPTPSEPPTPPTHLQEWILFYLLEREKSGRATKGNDLFWPSDVEPLVEMGLVALSQSHDVPSLQTKISGSTVVSLTDTGRHYFER